MATSQAPFLLRPIPGWVPLGQSPNADAGAIAIAVPPLPMNVASAASIPPTTVACSHPGCNVRFSDVQALQAHAYTLKHMPFACQFCTHRFASCNDYIRHLFNIHNSDSCTPPRAVIACWPICADCLLMCPDVWDAQEHGKEACYGTRATALAERVIASDFPPFSPDENTSGRP
ncbi:hypothetical protein EXIGLDRAFT_780964 [Exidia glandulosa HHB12029]|uniref:C2H2-type domain-containing protein n=1 Tax=Exidia glandulosa HHB12029 TaxID=1314781 RepID=A0A165BDY6_EXIGL|nr:hypothetical protein EXIGLDRAFT_780964 [Exidia glandulosa HHB12029]